MLEFLTLCLLEINPLFRLEGVGTELFKTIPHLDSFACPPCIDEVDNVD